MFYGKDTPSIFLTERICQKFRILFDLIKTNRRFSVNTIIVILTFYTCFCIKVIYRVQITFSAEWSHQLGCSTDHIAVIHVIIPKKTFVVVTNKASASPICCSTIRIISCAACVDIVSDGDSIHIAVCDFCPVCLNQVDTDVGLYIIIFRYDSVFVTWKLNRGISDLNDCKICLLIVIIRLFRQPNGNIQSKQIHMDEISIVQCINLHNSKINMQKIGILNLIQIQRLYKVIQDYEQSVDYCGIQFYICKIGKACSSCEASCCSV